MNSGIYQDPLLELTKRVLRKNFQDFAKGKSVDGPLTKLLIYLLLKHQEMDERAAAATLFRKALKKIGLSKVIRDDVLVMLIEEFYLKNDQAESVAQKLKVFQGNSHTPYTVENGPSVHNLINAHALDTVKSAIASIEIEAREERQVQLTALYKKHIPTQIEPVGIDCHIHELSKLLSASAPPWLVNIHGDSGVGKTTFTYKLVQHISESGFTWPEILWLSLPPKSSAASHGIAVSKDVIGKLAELVINDAPNLAKLTTEQLFVEFRKTFVKRRYIIVIDNLETVSEIEAILPDLRRLSDPTKFILVSQSAIYGAPDVRNEKISDLSPSDSFSLLRSQADLNSLEVNDESLRRIYEHLGGNPKLLLGTISQMEEFGIDETLQGLDQGNSDI